MISLSIPDLSPVSAGSRAAQALRNSLDLARLANGLGFTRYWLAEHHNLPAIASSAPDIMIGQIAAVTQNMRVGSGGIMLPNHALLMVAERFKVSRRFIPVALISGWAGLPAPIWQPLMRFGGVKASVSTTIFSIVLTSLCCWRLAAFPPATSAVHVKPYAILATQVVCADTDEEAERLASI